MRVIPIWFSLATAAIFIVGVDRTVSAVNSSSSSSSRVSGNLTHFEFSQRDCLKRTFSDSAPEALFGAFKASNAVFCRSGIGASFAGAGIVENYLSEAQVVSTKNSSSFLHRTRGAQALTFEIWVQPYNSTSDEPRTIFSLSGLGTQKNQGATNMPCDPGEGSDPDSHFGIQLTEIPGTLQASLSVASEPADPLKDDQHCPEVFSSNPVLFPGTFVHLTTTVAWSKEEGDPTPIMRISLYVNGVLEISRAHQVDGGDHDDGNDSGKVSSTRSTLAPTWDEGFHLQLFGDNSQPNSNPFTGVVYAFSMYDFALNGDQVLQNFRAKLPNSLPVVFDALGVVNEDGISEVMRKHPEAYPEAFSGAKHEGGIVYPTSLMWVELLVVDQDEDEMYLNYVAANNITDPPRVFLSSLPSLLTTRLFDYFNGSEITSVPFEVQPVFEDNSTGVVYSAVQAAIFLSLSTNNTTNTSAANISTTNTSATNTSTINTANTSTTNISAATTNTALTSTTPQLIRSYRVRVQPSYGQISSTTVRTCCHLYTVLYPLCFFFSLSVLSVPDTLLPLFHKSPTPTTHPHQNVSNFSRALSYLPIDNFTYYAVDGVTGERSAVDEDATLSFVVLPGHHLNITYEHVTTSLTTSLTTNLTANLTTNLTTKFDDEFPAPPLQNEQKKRDPPSADSFQIVTLAGVSTVIVLMSNGTGLNNEFLNHSSAYITRWVLRLVVDIPFCFY